MHTDMYAYIILYYWNIVWILIRSSFFNCRHILRDIEIDFKLYQTYEFLYLNTYLLSGCLFEDYMLKYTDTHRNIFMNMYIQCTRQLVVKCIKDYKENYITSIPKLISFTTAISSTFLSIFIILFPSLVFSMHFELLFNVIITYVFS